MLPKEYYGSGSTTCRRLFQE